MNHFPNKGVVAQLVSEKTGYTLDESKFIVDTTLEAIKEAIKKEGAVCFQYFGTFKITTMKEQPDHYNPHTGGKMVVAARKRVRFSPSKTLKDYINN